MIQNIILLFFYLFDQIAFRDYIFFDLATKSYFTNIVHGYTPATITRGCIMLFLYWSIKNLNPQYIHDRHHRHKRYALHIESQSCKATPHIYQLIPGGRGCSYYIIHDGIAFLMHLIL